MQKKKIWRRWRHGPSTTISQNLGGGEGAGGLHIRTGPGRPPMTRSVNAKNPPPHPLRVCRHGKHWPDCGFADKYVRGGGHRRPIQRTLFQEEGFLMSTPPKQGMRGLYGARAGQKVGVLISS